MILSAVLAIAVVSCTKDETYNFVATTGVALTPSTVSIYPGDITKVEANLSPASASPNLCTWTTSNSKVATVDTWGRVTGVAPGEATITVTTASGKCTASCKVTVKEIEATSVSLSATEMTVYIDEYGTLTATVAPDNTSVKTITWTSSDPSIASVDENGKVTGIDLGTAVITATTKYGPSAKCTVTVKVRTPTEAETVDLWKADKAGYRGLLGAASDNGKTAGNGGWLSYQDGVAYWTENTTGETRTATLELSTGSKITIRQISAADFKGSYVFNAKFFSNNTKWTTAGNSKTLNVTFGDPILGETLKDVEGTTHVNAIGISGLYFTAIMDAAVDIDYENKTVKLGLFLDARDNAQQVENFVDGYNYACFLPEMGTGTGTSWASPWNFVQPDLGSDCDYCWLWFDCSDDFTKFTWNSYSSPQFVTSDKATSANRIIGITCAVSNSKQVTSTTVKSTYNVIYQGNVNNTTTTPVSFTKQ